jgi:hypothetical protein
MTLYDNIEVTYHGQTLAAHHWKPTIEAGVHTISDLWHEDERRFHTHAELHNHTRVTDADAAPEHVTSVASAAAEWTDRHPARRLGPEAHEWPQPLLLATPLLGLLADGV